MSDTQEDTSVGPDGLIRPRWATVTPELQHYYDHEWGMPIYDERGVFERLVLECFQAGLSWRTILEKRAAFRAAFYDFDVDRVALMTEVDVERLMQDVGIVRNRRKIEATIHNAAATIALREDGGLSSLVWFFQPPVTPMPRYASAVPTQSARENAETARVSLCGPGFDVCLDGGHRLGRHASPEQSPTWLFWAF